MKNNSSTFEKKLTSKYVLPDTNVLMNLANIEDEKQLESYERKVALERLVGLQKSPVKGNFDLKHIQKIHCEIFGSVYPFAGEIREENIGKGFLSFCPAINIKTEANKLFAELKRENYLKGLDKDKMASRLAYYMAEINIIHIFREGNGRTQREFIRTLAAANGYQLNWSKLIPKELFDASVRSIIDTTLLKEQILKAL